MSPPPLWGHSWLPGQQGHAAEAGVGTGPCPWSSARLQLCALLGALSHSHCELPTLL